MFREQRISPLTNGIYLVFENILWVSLMTPITNVQEK